MSLILRIFLILFLTCSLASADDFLFKVGKDAKDIKVSGSLEDENAKEIPEQVKVDNAPDKWEGYLEFTGRPGTTRHLGVSDLLVPLLQDQNDMLFLNVRGQLEFDSDSSEINIGLGHRHQFDKFILGAYTFYDRKESDQGYEYGQGTIGVEFLSEKWDVRMNGYIADEDENDYDLKIISENSKLGISEDDVWVDIDVTGALYQEKSHSGFDGEVGYKLPFLEDTRIYAGGYHFIGENGHDSVSGPRLRLETRLYDLSYLGNGSRIMVGIESQHDDPRGTQTSGLLSLRIPFGIESKKPLAKLAGLDRRMMEPVVRDIDIVTTENHFTENIKGRGDALNPEGETYTKIMRFDTETSMADMIAGVKAETAKGELPLVIIRNSVNNTAFQVGNTKVAGGATYAMAGKDLYIGYRNQFLNNKIKKFSFTPEGDAPTMEWGKVDGKDDNSALLMEAGAHINGWNVDATGYRNGIFLDEAGSYFITGSTIKNAIINVHAGGITAKGEGVIVHITDSESSNNGGLDNRGFLVGMGFRVEDGAKMILDDVVASNNGFAGVLVGTDSELIIKDSSFFGNKKGLHIQSDYSTSGVRSGTVFVSGSKFFDNVRGIESINGEYLEVVDSEVYNNSELGFGLYGAKLTEIKNTIIHDNPSGIVAISQILSDQGSVEVTLNNVSIVNNSGVVFDVHRDATLRLIGDSTIRAFNSDIVGRCWREKDKTPGVQVWGTIYMDGAYLEPRDGPCQ